MTTLNPAYQANQNYLPSKRHPLLAVLFYHSSFFKKCSGL
jgi:hypothetical protein